MFSGIISADMENTKEAKYYANSREDLIEHIPASPKHVLDVGCGIGNVGRAIKKTMGSGVEVIGVEIFAGAAEKAMKDLDRVIVGDVEKVGIGVGKGYFDAIIYGDILEHLLDPWGLLKRHSEILRPGGRAIASVPNIAHYRTIKMLRRKEWKYEKSGIMDVCHLRFFTIKSIRRMFEDAGFGLVKAGHIISASKSKKILNKVLRGLLTDYITEQYIIVAEKK
jgi:2-polyprenyl-3-methyl-5-hydroxy-6-metoxy-1,4-benzoquinol methylase